MNARKQQSIINLTIHDSVIRFLTGDDSEDLRAESSEGVGDAFAHHASERLLLERRKLVDHDSIYLS